MADKKLNEVTKVTDMAYVPVIMADGSVGQIAKSDLASVVAGVFDFVVGKVSPTNIDEITTTSIISLNSSNTSNKDMPSGVNTFNGSKLMTAAWDVNSRFQLLFTYGSVSRLFYRTCYSSWGDWQRIDNFGYNSLAELSAEVVKEADLMPYRGHFTLNEEDGNIETGWCSNWTSGVIGGTFLEVFNDGSFILQRETNPYVDNYCRIRMSTNGGSTWSGWKKVSLL